MFGLSWGQITIIVLVGVFILGPERIPTAVRWVMDSLRKLRTMAAGAQAQLNREIGPELDELRRQIADLQSLKELQELRDLRELHPKRLIGNTILGEEFTGGGIGGFLGLNSSPGGSATGTATGTGPAQSVKPVSAVPPSAPSAGGAPTATESVVGSAPATRPAPPPAAGNAPTGRLAAPKVVGAPRRAPAPIAPAANAAPAGFDHDAT